MTQSFQDQHAASLVRIAAGGDILAARVTVDSQVLTVRADQVGLALVTLHGTPTPGLKVSINVEYLAMSAHEFESLPEWQ